MDGDPQGSVLAWFSARDPLFPVVGMAKPTLHRDLPEIGVGGLAAREITMLTGSLIQNRKKKVT